MGVSELWISGMVQGIGLDDPGCPIPQFPDEFILQLTLQLCDTPSIKQQLFQGIFS